MASIWPFGFNRGLGYRESEAAKEHPRRPEFHAPGGAFGDGAFSPTADAVGYLNPPLRG